MRLQRFAIFAFLIFALAPFAYADDLSVTPAVIDEKAKPRDIIKQTITILNTSDRKLNLYPSVNDINVQEGEQAFAAASNADERAVSLANWIELSRGVVELGPGEEKVIPFVIRVHLAAAAGAYHAAITFADGSTREMAEASAPLSTIDVNVDVAADIKETMQLNKFFTDRIFFSGDDVLFNLQLENIGNQDLKPKGEIRVYDRRGKEVAALDVNKDGQMISPDQVSQLASVWSAAQGFGRYKAFLNVDFGASQKASVQDTIYFWVVPWQQLLGLLTASIVAVIFLALYVHRTLETRHRARLAHALESHGVEMPQEEAPAKPSVLGRVASWRAKRREARAEVLSAKAEKEKKRWSERLEKEPPAPVQPITAPADTVIEAPSPAHPHPHHHAHGHSIDLKKLHAQPEVKKSAAHVINLKGHS